jgi:hypothetical protein
MANGEDQRRYISVTEAQLGERVTNLGRRVTDIEGEMRAGFRQIETSIAGLAQNLAERNKPQWQALGVALTFAGMLGALAYLPIREATNDLKNAVATLAEKTITRQEMDWRSDRAAEDRQRMEKSIADLRDGSVGRAEWVERSKLVDQAIQNSDRRTDDTNKRIDELRQDFGAVYGTRDVIRDLKSEIDELRQRVNRPREP